MKSAKKMPAKTAKIEDVDMLANLPKAKDPVSSSKKKVTTITSTDQLQVYLKPEFKNFTQTLQPQRPGTIRPKRMDLHQTLRLIEELYSHRFGKKESMSFHESIVDYF